VDHETALATHVVERYLLGELSPAEAREFELHFFACSECAAAVDEGWQLMSGIRDAAERRDDSGDPGPD
jgi:anti-sigma factor RsiW